MQEEKLLSEIQISPCSTVEFLMSIYSVDVCKTSTGLSSLHTTMWGISMKENYGNAFREEAHLLHSDP